MVLRITDVLTKSTIITIRRKRTITTTKKKEKKRKETDLVAAYFSNQYNP